MILGIFDSGVGGLTVVNEILNTTSINQDDSTGIVYIGDIGRAPYGNKSEFDIKYYSAQIINKLKSLGATHFISACNSISANLTTELLNEIGVSDSNWIDMVGATSKHFNGRDKSKVIVVATNATINSGVYCEVFGDNYIGIALPNLASMIEGGADRAAIFSYIKSELENYLVNNKVLLNEIGYLFLGCTHYPLAKDIFSSVIKDILGASNIKVIDPAEYVAKEVVELFKINKIRIEKNNDEKEENSQNGNINKNKFYTTKDSDIFKSYVSSLGLANMRECKVINL